MSVPAPGRDQATAANVPGSEPHLHSHPTPRQYVNIALFLGAITAIEVATYYFRLPTWALWTFLTLLAIAKFATVVGYYMHLKFDNRMFRRVFAFGLALALSVFLLVIGIFAVAPEYGAEEPAGTEAA